MRPQFDQVQIERYLKEQMVPVEVDIFEGRLRDDNVLMAEVKAFARINELPLPDREILRKEPSKAAIAEPTELASKGSQLKWFWLIALLLLAAVWYYFVAT